MKGVDFFSSDRRIREGFLWARDQALVYVRDRAVAGPCYEAALPRRDSFCMRDVSHQCGGAHCLGLLHHNRNMMRLFAKNISASRDFCSYWEITSEGLPTPVDYTNDRDFWYNLPANFDVMDACSRLYDLTGDAGYLLEPEMSRFHSLSVHEYVQAWDRDGDGIPDRRDRDGRRGIASYDEENTEGYSIAADTLSLQYAAYMAAARMYGLSGDPVQSEAQRTQALRLENMFQREWWDEQEKHFHEFKGRDGRFYSAGSYENAFMPLRCGMVKDPRKREEQLNYVLSMEPEMNVEIRSYLPLVLWQNGRDREAMRVWLKMTDAGYHRREYPEVSYAAVEGLVFGYMGLQSNADTGSVTTRSALQADEWAQITGLPLWGGTIDLRHEGSRYSKLTNLTDRTISWNAVVGREPVCVTVEAGQTAEAGI